MNKRLVLFVTLIVSAFFLSCNKEENIDTMSGLYDLYIYDLNKATNTKITDSPTELENPLAFSKDCKEILFKNDAGIYAVKLDGSDFHVVIPSTSSLINWDISLSNNGNDFAYTKDNGGALYLMNSDGTNERLITYNIRFKLWKPIWSKDDNLIACCSDSGIVTVNMNGNYEIISTEKPAQWYDWSFDSKKLAYSKYSDNKYSQIFVFDLETKNESKITSYPRYCYNAFWRPGKSEIIFTSSTADYGSDLILTDADASDKKTILHQKSINTPVWSPDGTKIAFITENSDLAVIDIDGDNYKVLNNIPGACMTPIWSPDGNYILYNRAIFYN